MEGKQERERKKDAGGYIQTAQQFGYLNQDSNAKPTNTTPRVHSDTRYVLLLVILLVHCSETKGGRVGSGDGEWS